MIICAQGRWYLCKGLERNISCVDEEYSPNFLTVKLAIIRTWRDLIFSYSRLIWWIIFLCSFCEYVERRKHWLSNHKGYILFQTWGRGVVVINFIPWDKFGAVCGTLAIFTKLTNSKSKSRLTNGFSLKSDFLTILGISFKEARYSNILKTKVVSIY